MKQGVKKSTDQAESRRKFLKTAGKFAVYAPPALMVMTQANAKEIYKSVKVNCNNGGGNGSEGCDASSQANSNNDGDR